MTPRHEKIKFFAVVITLSILIVLGGAYCIAQDEKKYDALTSAANVIMALGAVAIPLAVC